MRTMKTKMTEKTRKTTTTTTTSKMTTRTRATMRTKWIAERVMGCTKTTRTTTHREGVSRTSESERMSPRRAYQSRVSVVVAHHRSVRRCSEAVVVHRREPNGSRALAIRSEKQQQTTQRERGRPAGEDEDSCVLRTAATSQLPETAGG